MSVLASRNLIMIIMQIRSSQARLRAFLSGRSRRVLNKSRLEVFSVNRCLEGIKGPPNLRKPSIKESWQSKGKGTFFGLKIT